MASTTELIDPRLTKLSELIGNLHENIREAGRLVVELLEGGYTINSISKANQITFPMLRFLERVGRDQIVPELYFAPFPAARRIQFLPRSEQERLLKEPVSIMVLKDGEPDTLQIPIQDLSTAQLNQIFLPGTVPVERSLAAQRLYLLEQAANRVASSPWSISKGVVIVNRPCRLTHAELEQITFEVKRSLRKMKGASRKTLA